MLLLFVSVAIFCFVACRDLLEIRTYPDRVTMAFLNLRTPMPLALGMHKGLLKTDQAAYQVGTLSTL